MKTVHIMPGLYRVQLPVIFISIIDSVKPTVAGLSCVVVIVIYVCF